MRINFGYIINKVFKLVNRPALRNCEIDKTAKIGAGSNCIAVQVGRYSYMGKNNSIAYVSIGSFCSIASYCAIGGGAHSLNNVSTSPVFCKGKNIFGKNLANIPAPKQRKVVIGNDVWIGEGVFISEGVNIGDGAVIGAHSVVTHDVLPYSVVAGAPARHLRYRFNETDIAALLDLKWWEWSDEKLMARGEKFGNISMFLEGEVGL